MFEDNLKLGTKIMLLGSLLAGSVLFSTALAQSPGADGTSNPAAPTRYEPNRFPKRERAYYQLVWGVDSFVVKLAESDEVVRFTYRVLDPNKAKALNDKSVEPYLIDPQVGVKLVVPALEKVGQLRQTATPEAGKSYWMVFSNKGRLVKRGARVTVQIGSFKIDGLEVQ